MIVCGAEGRLVAIHALCSDRDVEYAAALFLVTRSPEQQQRLNRIILLRRVELMEMAASRDASNGMWSGLLNEMPANTDWILNTGLLPPTLDPTVERPGVVTGAGDGKGGASVMSPVANTGASKEAADAAAAAAAEEAKEHGEYRSGGRGQRG